MASFPDGYPAARRLDLVEELFGHRVADPYRWLEDADSAETRDWLAAEETLWAGYRDGLPRREAFTARVRELLRVGTVGLPAWRGTTRFSIRRDPDQEHAVLYVSDHEISECGAPGCRPARGTDRRTGAARLLTRSDRPNGRTTLDAWSPDKEGRLLAYQLSQGGDEESLLRVMDVATGEVVDGPIDRCRYSGVAWLPGGKAFYYSRRLPADAVPDGRSAVPPAGVPARGGDAAGGGRGGVRRGAGQDQLLRGQRQQGRALAGHLDVGRDRAQGGHLDRRPDRVRPGGTGAGPAHGRARRAWPRRGSGGTGSSTCSPTWTRRAAGSALPTRQRQDRTAGGTLSPRTRRPCCGATRSSTARNWRGRSSSRHGRGTRSARSASTTWPPGSGCPSLSCRGSGRSAGSGSGRRAGTRRGSATRTTRPPGGAPLRRQAGAIDTWATPPGAAGLRRRAGRQR